MVKVRLDVGAAVRKRSILGPLLFLIMSMIYRIICPLIQNFLLMIHQYFQQFTM